MRIGQQMIIFINREKQICSIKSKRSEFKKGRMSVKNKEQISIHLKTYRNLSNYTTGRYLFRISLTTQINNKLYYALPINVIQKKPCQGDNQPQTDQCYYMTKSFVLKGGMNADIDQVCIFRFDVEMGLDEKDYTEIDSVMVIQMVHVDYVQMKICNQYVGRFKGIVSDVLVVDFFDSCPGQLIGSVHSCILSYEYIKAKKPENKVVSKQVEEIISEILKYLQDMSERNVKKTQQNLERIKGDPVVLKEQEIGNKLNRQKTVENLMTQAKTDRNSQDMDKKRKRKPIFENNLPLEKKPIGLKKSLKLIKFDNSLHENSLRIYETWRQLNQLLMTQKGDEFISRQQKQHHIKLRNKVGESVIRFKGLKDLDQYSDYQEMQRRNKMVNQLRNQSKQHLAMTCEFSIMNQKDFTKERPIFFEQSVSPTENSKHLAQKPYEFMLIFLVHGLGACRLDMEKLKIQLKRYHQTKIKIYVSTSNESRTQGDIDGMGLRLAGEVEAEIAKTKGDFKISMIGHSMGGLIIRSALPRLQKHKDKFHSLVTFSSPHIGYAYSSSKLVDAGLWLMNTMKKCTSIEQMTMTDSPVIQQCFLYKLSQQKGLEWFKKITFLASHQDSYVPFYSARIQKSKEIQTDFKKGFSRGILYCQMIDNILNRINGKLIRLDVNFCIQEQNIDNLIGRAAHISFINNAEMLRTFCIAEESSVF